MSIDIYYFNIFLVHVSIYLITGQNLFCFALPLSSSIFWALQNSGRKKNENPFILWVIKSEENEITFNRNTLVIDSEIKFIKISKPKYAIV